MRVGWVFGSCVVVLACGARSTLDAFGPADATMDAISPASDAATTPDVSPCTYSPEPCDAGVVAPCDGCALPNVLATCQSLPSAIAVDDASVVWINEGIVASEGGHKVPPTFKNGSLVRCAKSGCGGLPSPIVTEIEDVWPYSFAISGSTSCYWAPTNSGPMIYTVDDAVCTTGPTGFAGAGDVFAADETTVYYTTWSGNTVEACSAVNCVTPMTLWTAPTLSILTMGIAIDATDVYWSTTHGEIYRCAKSGCAGTPTLVTHTLAGIGAIALDDTNVYAAGVGLLSCPKTGCAQPVVLTTINPPDGEISQASELVTDGKNLYWPRIMAVFPTRGGLFRCPVAGCSAPEQMAATMQPGGIAIDGTRVYWSDTTSGTISSLPK